MLTNNYDLLNSFFGTGGFLDFYLDFTNIGTIKNTSGVTATGACLNGCFMSTKLYQPFTHSITSSYNASTQPFLCVYLGTGTTEPTKDDYTMGHPLTSTDISVLENLCGLNIERTTDGKIKKTITIKSIMKNKSGASLDISEFGITQFLVANSYSYQFLMYRETFDPVTIPADGVFTFEKTITIEGNS